MKTTDPLSRAEPAADDALEICISCLQTNPPGTHFCRHCGTPLTSYAATGPFESIFAEGDFLRKAASRGRWSGWVRAGVVVLLLLMLVGILLGFMLPR